MSFGGETFGRELAKRKLRQRLQYVETRFVVSATNSQYDVIEGVDLAKINFQKMFRYRGLRTTLVPCALLLISQTFTSIARANEIHVSKHGNDASLGRAAQPLRTISAASKIARPGDTVTVHAGVYRERVSPTRGGTSDVHRITYRAAVGEKVVLTGSERAKGWKRISDDTWKLTLSNTYFGAYNPYADLIHGDWFADNGRRHHTGCVYLNGDWLMEAPNLTDVLKRPGKAPLWYALVDGVQEVGPEYLLNIAWLQPSAGLRIRADLTASASGTQVADCSEGGKCIGYIRNGNWVRYNKVDFGSGTSEIQLRAAAPPGTGGIVELRLDSPAGRILGTCDISVTGGWQTWRTFAAKIQKTAGVHSLCLRFRWKTVTRQTTVAPHTTEIYAQFPGVDPNRAEVEINVRPTVFTPAKSGIDYITLRGFDLRNAATNWAPPSAAQYGIVSAYWCKGWLIEDNEISYSKCCGIALGKYGDEFDNTNFAGSADPYTDCVRRALKHGWNKATVGGHIVRNNHIHHCEQTGVVGSLGCSFSQVIGNEIHDIHIRQLFGGAEMAGIKFHGAIDVVIKENHIYRCGDAAGIWLDWMAQNAQVLGNLMHDNTGGCGDIFCEMQHGPLLLANNLLLSKSASVTLNSQGIAFAHNLFVGPIVNYRGDGRTTPFHDAHSTRIAGLYNASKGDSGDLRFYNNVFAGNCSLNVIDPSAFECFAAGNDFTKGTLPSKFDVDLLRNPEFDAYPHLTQKPDGWYLTVDTNPAWRTGPPRKLVTSALLGKARVSECRFENIDGTPLRLDSDYFGKQRNSRNPCPGPIEVAQGGMQIVKVWPKRVR